MKRKFMCVLLTAMMLSVVGCGKDTQVSGSSDVVTDSIQETKPSDEDTNQEQDADSSQDTTQSTENNEGTTADTLGNQLVAVFNSEVANGSSVEACINALMAASGYDCGNIECEEGYLNGFSDEVKGFSKATMFSPYIGSIPFVGYIFETENPEALQATLLELADPCWNICTRAEETVSEINGNYVFFAMCPGEDF